MGMSLRERIVGICAEVLDLPPQSVAADQDLFDLGMQSLQMVTLLARLQEEIGFALAVEALYENPTPELIAAQVEAGLAGTEGSRPGESSGPTMTDASTSC